MASEPNPNTSANGPKSGNPRRSAVSEKIPPELVDHPSHEILGVLGKGGMGIVYKARSRAMGRIEALKVVHASAVSSASALERFQQEIRSAARLQHTNIVTAYHVIDVGGRLGLVMEYVPGQTLTEIVKTYGPVSATNACHYARQVAAGLQHAMSKGLVHRDIKPDNLMLSREGSKHTVKILDFGLGKASSEASLGLDGKAGLPEGSDANLTQAGSMLGTPYYVAPEQITNAAAVDIRSDIYSLGCTLFYLLTGRQPYVGKTLKEILEGHLGGAIPGVRDLRPELPAALDEYVRVMMAKDPAARPQQPREVVNRLNELLRDFAKSGSSAGGETLPEAAKTAGGSPPGAGKTVTPGAAWGATMPAPIWDPLPAEPETEFDFKRTSSGQTTAIAGREFDFKPDVMEHTSEMPEVPSFHGIPARDSGAPPATGTPVFTQLEPTPEPVTRRPRSRKNSWIYIAAGSVFMTILTVVVLSKVLAKPRPGYLILTVSEPESEVLVDGVKVRLTVLRNENVEVTVAPGAHKLEVRKTGFVVFVRELQVAEAGKETLTATLERLPEGKKVSMMEPANEQPAEAFVRLMTGNVPGPDWRVSGATSTRVSHSNGVFVGRNTEPPGNPTHVFTTRKDYQDFRLRTEFFVDDEFDHLTICTRLSPSEAKFGGMRGYHVAVDATEGKKAKSRCVIRVGVGARLRKGLELTEVELPPLTNGRWHQLEIQHTGNFMRVSVNGASVVNTTDEGRTFLRGAIGMVLRSKQPVKLRNLEILETAPTPMTPFSDDGRTRWAHQSLENDKENERAGVLQQTGKSEWIETVCDRAGCVRFHFREISRNGNFVEIERPGNPGLVSIRMHEGFSGIAHVRNNYVGWHAGRWQK